MDWIKKNKKSIIVVSFILCALIPVSINILLSFNVVPSSDTSSGDWLGFWGSFLGSIIGGGATLIGVLLTLDKMEDDKQAMYNDKKREEEKKYPFLVPLKKTFTAYGFGTYQFTNKTTIEEIYSEDPILLELINIGEEHALNNTLQWQYCNAKDLYDYLTALGLPTHEGILRRLQMEENLGKSGRGMADSVQIIRGSNSNESYKIYLELTSLDNIIKFLVAFIANNSTPFKEFLSIPIGGLKIISQNVYGSFTINKEYFSYMDLIFYKSDNSTNLFLVTLNFLLKNQYTKKID